MPFNKGDFTQQGVAGHVNANLRLNEKRLVNIDLTTDEEAEGCTIAGTVKDLLNDKVYGIGAGVSGNIEITENGENINVAPYATATVNVSGGGGGSLEPVTLADFTATSEDDGDGGYIIKKYDENYRPLYPGFYICGYLMGLTIVFDNVEYNCKLDTSSNSFGAPLVEGVYDYSIYPFAYVPGMDEIHCNDNAATSHTVKLIMKPSIGKVHITNSMNYDIPMYQTDTKGNYAALYPFAKAETLTDCDVILFSNFGVIGDASFNSNPIVFTDLTDCSVDSNINRLVVSDGASFTISQEPKE